MNFLQKIAFKRGFLYALIASVSISALLGIIIILSGDYDETKIKVLLTTLTVAVTSICGLACGAFLESRQAQNSPLVIVPMAGILSALTAALTLFWLIWLSDITQNNVNLIKTSLCSSIFAFALAHLSLLSLAKLADRYKWALVVAYVAILFLASFISLLILAEPQKPGLGTFQLIGVAAVIDAAFSIMIPIFHRLSRADFQFADKTTVEQLDVEIENLKHQLSELERRRREILDL